MPAEIHCAPRAPIRPSIPPLVWAAAAFWAGVTLAESVTWSAHTSGLWGQAGWLACAAALLGVTAGVWPVVTTRSGVERTGRSVATLAAVLLVGLAAGFLVGEAFWLRWERDVATCARQGTGDWTVEVTGEGVDGPFGATVPARVTGPVGSGSHVVLRLAKGAAAPEPGTLAQVAGGFLSTGRDEAGRRLHREGVVGAVRVRRVRAFGWGSDAAGRLGPVRAWASARLAEIPGDGSALLASVLLGDASRVSGTPVADDYKSAGVSHLVGASGVHLLVIAALAEWGLARVRASRWQRTLPVLALMTSFAAITGLRPSVVRGCVVALVASSAVLARRRGDGMAATAVAVTGMLAAWPPAGFSAGFALSVLGVAGTLVFGRLVEAWARDGLPRAARALAPPLALTVCAQLGTAALAVPLFGTFSLVAPVSNLLVAPVVVAATAGGLAALCASAVLPWAGTCALRWVAALAGLAAALARWFAALPSASVACTIPGPIVAACATLGAAAMWVLWPASTKARARVALSALVFMFATSACAPLLAATGPQVDVLDVGQGDAILVRDGAATMLVDAGPTPQALSRALTRMGVHRVDRFVITHLHDDHYGGMAALLPLHVREVLVPAGALSCSNASIAQADALVGQRNVHQVMAGIELAVGTLSARVVSPARPVADAATNEASVVMVVGRDSGRVLLTGDAESVVLDPLVANGTLGVVDVLKVGHHGSTDSVNDGLLRALAPRVCVISVGAHNRFGHPTRSTLALLAQADTRVIRTDQSGDIAIELAETGVRIRTSGRSVGLSPGAPQGFARTRGACLGRCATLVAATRAGSLGRTTRLENDGRRPVRSQTRSPDLRDRGPPAGAGALAAQEARG